MLLVLFAIASAQEVLVLNSFIDQQPDIPAFTFLQGGRDWPGLCANGAFQSPIDISDFPTNPQQLQVVTASNSTFRPYTLDLHPVPTSAIRLVENAGFATWLVFDTEITEKAGPYTINHTLVDVRIITPSEHTMNGLRYPLSMHFLYSVMHADGNFFPTVFMQVMYREGAHSPLLETLGNMEGDMDLSELFPANGVLDNYYTYLGSMNLPVPDCFEPRTWVIPNYVKEASAEQIAYWQGRYMNPEYSNGRGNVRALNPLGSRTLYHYVPQEQSQSFLM